ncbi:MAG: MFS transporter [Methyloglobulus sp.]|nr:MFS transporter [Methyloglobulus sp.]
MAIPTYLPYYILTGSVGIIAAILCGLHKGLVKAGWPTHERTSVVRTTAIVLIAWFAAAIILALLGAYHADSDRIPTIQYGIFTPILVGGFLIWRSPSVRRVIDAVPQQWLVGVQAYRALGVIFLILYATDRLPGVFAWPAGFGDVLVSLLAPIVALAYVRLPHENAGLVSMWNIFGLVDLVVAVTTGILTSPSPLQLFAFDHPNELITIFPLVLIPVFLVPVSVLLHLASLLKLCRSSPQGQMC